MANGKFSAYQRLQPVNWNIGNDLLNSEDQEFKHRAEDRLIEDRTKAQVDAELKKKQDEDKLYQDNMEKVYVSPTGYKSHDEPIVKLLQGKDGLFDRYSQVLNDLKKDGKNQSLIIKKLNMEKSIETLRGLRDGMVKKGQLAKQGLEDGTLSRNLNKDFFNNYDKMIGDYQYDYKIDDSGQILVENKAYDPDGDGIPNELTLNDLYDPEKMKLHKSFNETTWALSKKNEYGKHTEVKDKNGYIKSTVIGFNPDSIGLLNNDIENLFGKDLENMTNEAKAYIADSLNLDYKNIKESEFNILKNNLKDKVIAGYESTNKNEKNYSASQGQQRLNREDKQDNAFEPTLIQDTNGNATPYKVGTVNSKVKGVGFAVPQRTIQIGDKKINIQNFYLADNGKIAFSGNVTTTTPETPTVATVDENGKPIGYTSGTEASTKIEEITGGYLKETELTEVAKAYGLTPPQLKQKLEEVKKGSASNSNDNKQTDYRTKYSY